MTPVGKRPQISPVRNADEAKTLPVWNAAFSRLTRMKQAQTADSQITERIEKAFRRIQRKLDPEGLQNLHIRFDHMLFASRSYDKSHNSTLLLSGEVSKSFRTTFLGGGTLSMFVLHVSLACLVRAAATLPKHLADLARVSARDFCDNKFLEEIPAESAAIIAKQFLACLANIDEYSASREHLKDLLRGLAESMKHHQEERKLLDIKTTCELLTNPDLGDWNTRGNGANKALRVTLESLQLLFRKVKSRG